jgi:hypothetical protein
MKTTLILTLLITGIGFIQCETNDNDLSVTELKTHWIKGVRNLIDGPREYKFKNVSVDVGFVTSFPWEAIQAGLSEDVMDSVDIQYWIYTSIDAAELAMVEHLDMSNLYMRNILDFPLPGGEIGDNCWHQVEGGVVQFIRNNVLVFIQPPNFGDPFNWGDIELTARMIDEAIINAKNVSKSELVPAPVIHLVDIISSLPEDWGQSVKVKVNATDPNSYKLTFRIVGAGLALTNDIGIFNIIPDKSVPVFVCEDQNKFRIMIWVWNEQNLVSLAEKEFSFRN